MQKAVELVVNGRTLRGMQHLPVSANSAAMGDSLQNTKFPAVIIFHGFTGDKMGSHRMFVKISRVLEEIGYASFRFDFSGSGESDGEFEEMTVRGEIAEAEAILEFVRSQEFIDANNVSLVGHSLGGVVASIAAASHASRVHGVVLLCAAGNMRESVAWNLRELEQHLQGRPLPEAYDNEGDLVGLNFAHELLEMDLFELAKGFDKPVLLIHGSEDEAVPVETSTKYKELCYGDNAVLEVIQGADHSFNGHEWEETLLQHVRKFFS